MIMTWIKITDAHGSWQIHGDWLIETKTSTTHANTKFRRSFLKIPIYTTKLSFDTVIDYRIGNQQRSDIRKHHRLNSWYLAYSWNKDLQIKDDRLMLNDDDVNQNNRCPWIIAYLWWLINRDKNKYNTPKYKI